MRKNDILKGKSGKSSCNKKKKTGKGFTESEINDAVKNSK